MSYKIFLVAAEPSGDLLGRELAIALRTENPTVELFGIGGKEMRSVGLSSGIDISPLSVLGLFEGLKAYPKVIEIADAASEEIIRSKPDAIVLIDSWGFMLRVAQRVRKKAPNIRIIKLIGPQVWATRSGRAKTLANTVDHLLAMFDMEVPYYKPHGLKVSVIGNPAISRTEKGDGEAFRSDYGIAAGQKMLLVLPGSRPSEIKRVAPALVDAAELIAKQTNDVQIVFAPAHEVSGLFLSEFPRVADFTKICDATSNRYDAMEAADLAIACSGTVTSELAIQGTPFLVAYKLGWITWCIARGFLYRPDYMSLLNITAGDEIAPEFFQTKLKASSIADRALFLLNNEEALVAQQTAQNAVLSKMGAGGVPAAKLAADAILLDLREL